MLMVRVFCAMRKFLLFARLCKRFGGDASTRILFRISLAVFGLLTFARWRERTSTTSVHRVSSLFLAGERALKCHKNYFPKLWTLSVPLNLTIRRFPCARSGRKKLLSYWKWRKHDRKKKKKSFLKWRFLTELFSCSDRAKRIFQVFFMVFRDGVVHAFVT